MFTAYSGVTFDESSIVNFTFCPSRRVIQDLPLLKGKSSNIVDSSASALLNS